MPEWNVEVRRTVMQRQVVLTDADTPEEAKQRAIAHAIEHGSHDFWEDVDEVRPTNASRAVPWPEDPS